MKKFFLFLAVAALALTARAEVITLDLSEPANPESFAFGENGLWTETYNETDYEYFESQVFMFSHLPSRNSYSGTYWFGFTVSQATEDNPSAYGFYANTAKGGLKGEGTPYILAYYSEFWLMDENNEDMMSSNIILFNDGNTYYPRYVYLNNSITGYTCVTEGQGEARKFKQGDKFEVWIKGLDEDLEESDEKVVYRLADFTSENEEEWFVNTDWAKVDLSALGEVSGLSFTVVSTDQGTWGTNTSTYFALDGLTVSSTADEEIPTSVNQLCLSENVVIDVYTMAGQYIRTIEDAPQNIINILPQGAYLLRSADKTLKVVK